MSQVLAAVSPLVDLEDGTELFLNSVFILTRFCGKVLIRTSFLFL